MNDFTKEELIWLRWEIDNSLDSDSEEIAFRVRDKLVIMAENACPHEDTFKSYLGLTCRKCSAVVG